MQEKTTFLSEDKKIAGVLHLPRKVENPPCVVTCHGFESSKDSPKWIEIAETLCKEDFAVLRFDFRGCGESEGDKIKDAPNRIRDLESALNLITQKPFTGNIGLLGSSLGGCLSILAAADETYKKWVKAVVIWATPYALELMGYGDARETIKNVTCPIMIIHGGADELVPPRHAEELYKNARDPRALHIIDGADHRFMDSKLRRDAVNLSLDWFKRYLA